MPLTWCFALMLCLGVALAGTPALGHDLWIEPSTFHPATGELVWVGLRIGDPVTGAEPVRRDPRHLERFSLLGPEGETPIPGLDGREPAGWIRPSVPGRYTIVLRSHPAVSVLPPEKFESYLLDEGLEAIRDERARRGESNLPGKERYSRSLKALLTVAGPRAASHRRSAGADRSLGLRLELIARRDPQRLRAGDQLPVELRFEGRPLAGALVAAHRLRSADPEARSGRHVGRPRPLTARTDARGRVVFKLPEDGPWLLTAVHMVPAPPNEEEDWESVWTALTFSLGAN